MSKKVSIATWDWKEEPMDSIKAALKKIGIKVYVMPRFNGTDTYGFIFSSEKLSKKEVSSIEKTELGLD